MSVAEVAKGDVVSMLGFTGMKLGDFKAEAVTKSQIHVINRAGTKLIFDRKTGVQLNVEEGKEKYANKIVLPGEAPANKPRAAAAAKAKPAAKATKPAAVEEDEDEVPAPKSKKAAVVVDEDEDEAPAPKKKAAAETPTKKKKAVVVVDEDDYEEL